jgi:hypothetical protein
VLIDVSTKLAGPINTLVEDIADFYPLGWLGFIPDLRTRLAEIKACSSSLFFIHWEGRDVSTIMPLSTSFALNHLHLLSYLQGLPMLFLILILILVFLILF